VSRVLNPGFALNRFIDHTLLSPTAMDVAFESMLDEAISYNFSAVCVAPYIAGGVVTAMRAYPSINTCTVVAFPDGNIPLALKLKEAEHHIDNGVEEIDWVLHYGEVLNERWEAVETEIQRMGTLCKQAGVISKCIVETPILGSSEVWLRRVFETLADSDVDFIKTSTGRSHRGTLLGEVMFLDELRGDNERPFIKAAGGIKTLEQALDMIQAGADRLGMSASVGVMEQYNAQLNTFAEGEEETE
jgi:deoxyribose-phosphate aldolase